VNGHQAVYSDQLQRGSGGKDGLAQGGAGGARVQGDQGGKFGADSGHGVERN
jgi:hypothetical protein